MVNLFIVVNALRSDLAGKIVAVKALMVTQ